MMKFALRNLFRNSRRSIAILLTVALGTGSLFIFHGFNAGIMNQYRDNTIRCRYGHGQINTTGYREKVFEKPWQHWIHDWETRKASLSTIPGVKHLFPRVEFFALLTNGSVNVSGRGQGIVGEEESQFFNTLNIEEGVTLSNQSDGILLGRGLARALSVHPGDRVTVLVNTIHGSINGVDLTVTGIFHTGTKEFDDVVFRVPLGQAHTLLDTKLVESIAIGLDSVNSWSSFATAAVKSNPDLEATPFAVLDKVYYQNSVDWLDSQFNFIQIIILTVVILGIFNTVSTSILERRQEIGNLRANGESRWEVLQLLCTEGIAMGFLGALVGLFLATSLVFLLIPNGVLMPPAPGLTRQFFVRIELQPLMAIVTFLMGTATALFATLFASFRISRQTIGELLRST